MKKMIWGPAGKGKTTVIRPAVPLGDVFAEMNKIVEVMNKDLRIDPNKPAFIVRTK